MDSRALCLACVGLAVSCGGSEQSTPSDGGASIDAAPVDAGVDAPAPNADASIDAPAPIADAGIDAPAPVDANVPNYALKYTGSAFIQIPDAPSIDLTELTLEAWVQINGFASPAGIICKPLGNATEDSFALWLQSGSLNGGVNISSPTGALSAPLATDNVWHFVAYSYSKTAAMEALYIDGATVSQAATSLTPTFDGQALRIGGDSDYGKSASFFIGLIDEVRIWTVARSASQVATDQNARAGDGDPALAAHWTFDEGSGQVAHDVTGHGNDAQLGETPTADSADPLWITTKLP